MNGTLADTPGILMCRLARATPPPQQLPEIAYPLVAESLALSVGDVVQRSWQLRMASQGEGRELTLWQHVATRKGQDYSFETKVLSVELSTFVRRSLLAGEDMPTVFEAAREALAGRSPELYEQWSSLRAIRRTAADFQARFESILEAARGRQTTKNETARRLRELNKTSGRRAFIDGLEDGGRDASTITREELKTANDMSAELNQYVRPFVDAVYSERGITDGQAAVKPAQWWNSIYQIYVSGLLTADKNRMMKFRLGRTEKHCVDCLTLNGMVATAEQWLKTGLRPPNRKTFCGGHFCDCSLVDARETVTSPGFPPTLRGPRSSRDAPESIEQASDK